MKANLYKNIYYFSALDVGDKFTCQGQQFTKRSKSTATIDAMRRKTIAYFKADELVTLINNGD